ncbi:MAG: endolytic transglycosylase MltG [Treponema sp.]|jgi:UPF0755 protein|nr:endolytic transglycosylase MltG [Treponema sp.]
MPRPLAAFITIFCILIALVLLFSAAAIGAAVYFNAPPEAGPRVHIQDPSLRVEDSRSVVLEVRSGESARSVGNRLEEAGIIRSRYFWDLLARSRKEYIKTGTYRLELPASSVRLYSVLVSGKQLLLRVTIPEGNTLKKTARILEEAGICSASGFLAASEDRRFIESLHIPAETLEGYLYPDTYLFPPDYPVQMVIKAMTDTFFSRLEGIYPAVFELSPEEIHRKLILASIVEREYRVGEEAPIMAGIFFNRLEIGMALQSCATVEYVITEIQGRPHPEVLYTRDTEIRDPYNTYIRPGLPPGPISSPGAAALKAAFEPERSDYLYFRLADPETGRHYFSRTLDDHIRAGALYVKSSPAGRPRN